MLIVMNLDASREEIEQVKRKVHQLGCAAQELTSAGHVTLAVSGSKHAPARDLFLNMSGVTDVITVGEPFKLAGRHAKSSDTVIDVGGATCGGRELAVIAGPCCVESREQILETAKAVKDCGAQFLRGGAFKPRTSPYSFQGLKEEGLEYLAEARKKTGLKIVTEAKDLSVLSAVAEVADVIQIGSRNMQNFSLLEAVGDLRKPVVLKRGMSATLEEFLMAAEYVLNRGNEQVMLCERGIRTFETYSRNTLDLNAVPILKKLSHLPVIVDPSHGIGMWEGVAAMALAAVAAGADGLMIEVHPDPSAALSDGYQSLKPQRFRALMQQLKQLAPMVGRSLAMPRAAKSAPRVTVSA